MDPRRLVASFVLRVFDSARREYELLDLRTGETRRTAHLVDALAQAQRWSDDAAEADADDPE